MTNKRIYLCAPYERRKDMVRYASLLTERGHTITSRWIEEDYKGEKWTERAIAQACLCDLKAAEVIIVFTEPPHIRSGGFHVEFGYALALGLTIFIVGPKENIFHFLPDMHYFQETENWWLHVRFDFPKPDFLQGLTC